MGKNKNAADAAAPTPSMDADTASIITDHAEIAARIAEATAAKAPRPKRSCFGFLWAACIALLGAAFTGNLLMNGLEQAMFSSPAVSMRGVDFIQFSVCASSHHVVALATDPYKSIGVVASFRTAYSRACPRSWVVAKQNSLGAGSSARAVRIIACGVIFALAAPFFMFWSEASVPCALALLVLRVSLPEGAELNAGFIALMSYTGLHAVILIVKRYNLQL